MEQLYDALHIAVGALLFVIAGIFLIHSVKSFQTTVDDVGHKIETVNFKEKTECSEERTMQGYELMLLKDQISNSDHIFTSHIVRNKTYEVEFQFDSDGKLTKANYHE
jgi:hypothetical protein